MTRELNRREMLVLGYLERHAGEEFCARQIACVAGILEAQRVNETLRRLRGMGYVEGSQLTAAGQKMLWPHIVATAFFPQSA